MNKPQPCYYWYRAKGLSLIEMMVALALSFMLVAGIIQIYISSKQSYRLQEGQSRIQENARFAMELLQRDLRIAGFVGCVSHATPNVVANQPVNVSLTSPVTGYESTGSGWSPSLPTTLSSMNSPNHVIRGTDVIRIDFGESCGGNLNSNMTSDTSTIQIISPNTCDLQQSSCGGGTCTGDLILISDCQIMDLFRASSVSNGTSLQTVGHDNTVNAGNKLSKVYRQDAEVYKIRSYTYFIRAGESGIPALWRLNNLVATGGTNPLELVEGIEDLQILYGEDTDGNRSPNRYLPANQVDFANVASVRITLRARSPSDNLTLTSRTYSFDNQNVTDRSLARTFTTTIGVRNRLP